MKSVSLETMAGWIIRSMGVDGLKMQYYFDPNRPRRKADYAFPRYMLLIEIDGGTYARSGARRCKRCGQTPVGGHNTGAGYERDRVRDAEAAALGWTTLRFTAKMVNDGRMERLVRAVLKARMVAEKSHDLRRPTAAGYHLGR